MRSGSKLCRSITTRRCGFHFRLSRRCSVTADTFYDGQIKHILARHEQGATHAAEGYARVSGKTGVVVVTSGPGATNAITGITDAHSDSLPLVVFTGQVATPGIGKDAFQEADLLSMTTPITKQNYQVKMLKIYLESYMKPFMWPIQEEKVQ